MSTGCKAIGLLEAIEATTSRELKMTLLSGADVELRHLLVMALDPYLQYWIAKVDPVPSGTETLTEAKLRDYFTLLERLCRRGVTGTAARAEVSNFLRRFEPVAQKWMRRVLEKNLRAGIAASTVNKVWPNLIPDFKVMLAETWKDYARSTVYPVRIEPKYDGYRAIALVARSLTGGRNTVSLFSRKGNPLNETYPAVVKALQELELEDSDVAFDGELISDSFATVQRQTFRKDGKLFPTQYAIFECMTLSEWQRQQSPTQGARDLMLHGLLPNEGTIFRVPFWTANKPEEIESAAIDFYNQGYEGAIVKVPGYYEWKRSRRWLKIKSEIDADVEVIGVYEGEGKYAGSLGGIEIIQPENARDCRVGSGFSDEERSTVWDSPQDYIGRIAEVRYQEIGSDGRYRCPRFIRWRDDK